MKLFLSTLAIGLLSITLSSQDQLYRYDLVDINHYSFFLQLEDTTEQILGQAKIELTCKANLASIELDLAEPNDNGNGMLVHDVMIEQESIPFNHENGRLQIVRNFSKGAKVLMEILYEGIPEDGLIIGKNKYGFNTFFGDNWPDRAHHWLPCIDHPSDKATVEFIVDAPLAYDVIATGRKIEESISRPGRKVTHYSCPNPMPTKVMVIGVAEFAVKFAGDVYGHPVTSWVYPENRESGFKEYQPAVEILKFFVDLLGPYPNLKLANVQSKTRYGGMENAGNIFYYEGSINGKVDNHNLIAHEIAHQWFGNSASELQWHHVWLSEGFATFLTDHYIEKTQGQDSLKAYLSRQRQSVIEYYNKIQRPVVDSTITNYVEVLSPNVYQKGAWILQMLRNKIGEDAFWQGIKAYYQQYKYGNATSADFQRILEKYSSKDLTTFFNQWLYIAGHPILDVNHYQTKRKLTFNIQQTQDRLFEFPLRIKYNDGKGWHTKVLEITSKSSDHTIKVKGIAKDIILDPDVELLYDVHSITSRNPE